MDDIYMPSTIGKKIKVLCHIDTSGSICEEELTDFISELVGIARAYKNNVEFRILAGDTKIVDDILLTQGKGEKALKTLKLHGGGGTDHRPVFEYVHKKKYARDAKLLICFTDGASSFPEHTNIKTIFVLAGTHVPKERMPEWGKTIALTA